MINHKENYYVSNKDLISKTLARRMEACIGEYRLIKEKKSKVFKTVKEFCKHHNFFSSKLYENITQI